MKKLLVIAALAGIAGLIVACGHKGPLSLPDKTATIIPTR